MQNSPNMIQLILYRALPVKFHIGQVKIEKIEKWYGVGFKALITHDTIKKLKDNSDITNGTLGLLNAGGGIAAATATGAAMSTPIGPIVVLFTSLVKIYLGLIKGEWRLFHLFSWLSTSPVGS